MHLRSQNKHRVVFLNILLAYCYNFIALNITLHTLDSSLFHYFNYYLLSYLSTVIDVLVPSVS